MREKPCFSLSYFFECSIKGVVWEKFFGFWGLFLFLVTFVSFLLLREKEPTVIGFFECFHFG